MKALFIANPRSGPHAGRGRPIQDRLLDAARAAGIDPEIVTTNARGHAGQLAAAAVRAGQRLVISVGGDGTANEICGALAGSDTAMSVVPIGSGNGFARDFGVSLDIGRACRQIAAGRERRIDLGDVGGRPFLIVAGFGLDARVTHCFDAEAGNRRGMLPYVTITLREVFTFAPPEITIEVGGETRTIAPWLLTAANTRQLGGGAVLAPTASAEDGLLDFVLLPPVGLVRALVYGARLFSGSFDTGSRVEILRAESARIVASVDLQAQVDGEPLHLPPSVLVRCLPRALLFRGPG